MTEPIENSAPAGEDPVVSAEPVTTPPVAQPEPEPAPAPVDLVAEAGETEAKQPRSLDELGLDADSRAKVDSYISRSINDAKTKWETTKAQDLENGKYLTRTQVEDILQTNAVESQRREEARDNFVKNLAKNGIQVGSEEYDKVSSYYAQAAEAGVVTPGILNGEQNVRMLVQLAGAGTQSNESGQGPSSGLSKSIPEGSSVYAAGSIQLNAPGSTTGLTIDQQVQAAMVEATKNS